MRSTKSSSSYFVALCAVLPVCCPANAAVITSGCANASSCTLTELFAGGTITINNVLFNGWDFINDLADVNVTENNVTIIGIDNGGTVGLSFVFNPALLVANGDELEYTFDFDVSVVAPSTREIIMGDLNLTTSVRTGDAFAEINGTLTPGGFFSVGENISSSTPSASNALANLTSLSIETNIQLGAFDPGTSESLTQFDYGFTLTIPEPTSGLLVLIGVVVFSTTRSNLVN